MTVGALRRLDQLPAVVQGVGGGDLGGRVLAVLHGRDADGDVPPPRGGVVDQVEILLRAEALEVGLAAGVERGPGMTRLLDEVGGARGVRFADVANGGDHAAVDAHQVADVRGAHPADAHVPDAHGLERRGGEGLGGRVANPAGYGGRVGQAPSRRAGRTAARDRARGHSQGARLEEVPAVEAGGAVSLRFGLFPHGVSALGTHCCAWVS